MRRRRTLNSEFWTKKEKYFRNCDFLVFHPVRDDGLIPGSLPSSELGWTQLFQPTATVAIYKSAKLFP